MVWQNLKAGGFEEGQKIEYYKLPKRFKLLVTHSNFYLRCVLFRQSLGSAWPFAER